MVQYAMHPVEVGIMNDQTKGQADPNVKDGIIADMVINQRILPQGGKKDGDGIKCKN